MKGLTNNSQSYPSNISEIPTDINDIIFAGRNKEYGAYFIRKNYGKSILIASIIGISLTASAVGGSLLSKMLGANKLIESRYIAHPYTLDPPPPISPEEVIPPPAVVIPPPQAASIRFMPPEIVPDEKVKQEELPPVVDEMANKQISSVNQDGVLTDEIIIEPGTGNKEVVAEDKNEKIFTTVEIKPTYPGGLDALSKYLSKNLHYPRAAQRANVQGRVYLTFVVNSQGNISNVQVLKGIGFGCDEEASRVLQSMPSWNPGRQGGRAVSVKFTLPISFHLQGE